MPALPVIKMAYPLILKKPMITSGIRLGTPAGTTRGFGPEQFTQIGHMIGDVLDGLASNRNDNSDIEMAVRAKLRTCAEPILSIKTKGVI